MHFLEFLAFVLQRLLGEIVFPGQFHDLLVGPPGNVPSALRLMTSRLEILLRFLVGIARRGPSPVEHLLTVVFLGGAAYILEGTNRFGVSARGFHASGADG